MRPLKYSWRWKKYVQIRWYLPTILHGVINQRTPVCICTITEISEVLYELVEISSNSVIPKRIDQGTEGTIIVAVYLPVGMKHGLLL
jgi:hypothetical protein